MANIDTMVVNGRKLIVVERFDRILHADGSIDRLHQEDFCQATAVHPSQKYEEDGGPPLRRIADILQAVAPTGSVESLLRAVTLNVLIGNGDAHAKNFSLLHESSGVIRLAPLYDLMSTLFYGDERLAMFIDNVHRTDHVTAARMINEAAGWGMSRRRVAEIVADVLERVPSAVAAAETPGLPAQIPDIIDTQISRMRESFDTAN